MESYRALVHDTPAEDSGDRSSDVVAECAVSFAVGNTAAPAGLKLSAVAVSAIVCVPSLLSR